MKRSLKLHSLESSFQVGTRCRSRSSFSELIRYHCGDGGGKIEYVVTRVPELFFPNPSMGRKSGRGVGGCEGAKNCILEPTCEVALTALWKREVPERRRGTSFLADRNWRAGRDAGIDDAGRTRGDGRVSAQGVATCHVKPTLTLVRGLDTKQGSRRKRTSRPRHASNLVGALNEEGR
jgi:hypothetical protein